MTKNHALRGRAKAANVFLWQIAAELHISEPTLTRWLRFPLPAEKEERFLAAIQTISEKETSENAEKDV